jgi:hypothetical protein
LVDPLAIVIALNFPGNAAGYRLVCGPLPDQARRAPELAGSSVDHAETQLIALDQTDELFVFGAGSGEGCQINVLMKPGITESAWPTGACSRGKTRRVTRRAVLVAWRVFISSG